MAAAIPGSRVVIVADSGHMAPMEQPGAVSAAMLEWLR
jgi:pimeloyl-ACP methyl ester carboxylesterase